jgi:hypothetical protein
MLELASVTTAQGHTCISRLGRRISLEWCIWRLQQHGSQQQRGQLFGVLWLIRVVVAVLASAIGRGSEAAERSFGGLLRVGWPCSQRMIPQSSAGSCAPLPQWFRSLAGCNLACVTRCARSCANAVAARPLRRSRWRDRSRLPLVGENAPRNGDLDMCAV